MTRFKVIKQSLFFILSFIFICISWFGWWLHYTNRMVGNTASWMFWIFSMIFFCIHLFPKMKVKDMIPTKGDSILFFCISAVFICAHAFVFSHAPWNTYGLFDDAAWDIYFAHNHVLSGVPFQAAYFDSVGYISREVVFHYYITMLFRLFGYNLFVFTMGLLLLGYTTVICLVFLVQRLFNKYLLSAMIGILVVFWPLFYMHIYMGHRYAIAVPLMVCSLYFLSTGFTKDHGIRIYLSSLFAALCLGSSVMGKQFIYALLFAVGVSALASEGRLLLLKYRRLIGIWIVGFIIAATPLLAYIVADPVVYSIRETGLVREFIFAYKEHGLAGIAPYGKGMVELFFAPFSGRRQFVGGFPVIPLPYLLLIIPGLFIMWRRRRYELIAISILPIAGAFVSGAYDFRVLFAFPGWVLACVYTLEFVFYTSTSHVWLKRFSMGFICITIIFGYVPSVRYIYEIAQNPNGQYLLPHADVAVSRLVQDIAAGEEHPSIHMKWNEFNRPVNPNRPYDLFVAPAGAFAIMHLYLQHFDDKRILSFSDGGIQRLMSKQDLFKYNVRAIRSYQSHGKDLKLIWERTEKSKGITEAFKKAARNSTVRTYSDTIDGNPVLVDVLAVPSGSIDEFKEEIESMSDTSIIAY